MNIPGFLDPKVKGKREKRKILSFLGGRRGSINSPPAKKKKIMLTILKRTSKRMKSMPK